MIKLQVIGNLGKDCIVKDINGKTVINFSVAHSEKYKDSQGNLKERTTWVECAYWTDRTAISPYLTKGTTVYAEGSPEADAYMNKENQAAATLRMRVQNIQLLGSRQGGDNPNSNAGNNSFAAPASTPAARPAAASPVPEAAADDLPF
ncbi:MAG TPA: single-stranded DNA-binding protein [Ferruginibacter sp.]|nr:single-stranded DNA-binding protein [Ferruginibacter sp.]HPH91455.1 single-stranded DNA-binding protein [Ferruginibacter sp.]